ncbi:MAG: hypothetical protein JST31_09370 [Actinobacteria bacterium]|nr:hypothetical protein [Actinomycetota bacterium]
MRANRETNSVAAVAALPHVDEHTREVAAGPGETWEALLALERSFATGATPTIARLLGCEDATGFHVASAEPERELLLVGRHRFARYALIFRIEQLAPGRCRVRAETRAEFPGAKGRAYRALVIGSRGHVLATRRLLAGVGGRAERTAAASGRGG